MVLSSARCESDAFDCADVFSFRLCRIDPIYSLRGAESTTLGSEPFQCSLLSPQKPHCDSAVVRRRVGAVKSLSFVSDRARARGYPHSAIRYGYLQSARLLYGEAVGVSLKASLTESRASHIYCAFVARHTVIWLR